VTITDVARLAGVSPGTASKALNGKGGISPATAQLVRLAADRLGYQPNADELIQMRIFKVTPDFIQRMHDRGLGNLTISKLVQIRIFKLAD